MAVFDDVRFLAGGVQARGGGYTQRLWLVSAVGGVRFAVALVTLACAQR